MRIAYDTEVDTLYIRFRDTTVTNKHLTESISADYDSDGNLAGIEILDASRVIGLHDMFKQIILEDIAFTKGK